jgi:S-adenosylmethionine hydrolase
MASENALASPRPPIITLLTDFGLRDTYVGMMKGLILSAAPSVRIVDLTHEVAPQDVVGGAFLLETAWRYFPEGTVHVAVVDPGVGTARKRVAIASGGHIFIGPDNGVLSSSIPDAVRGQRPVGGAYEAKRVELPPKILAVSIENRARFRSPVSATFEGRDVFAPVAAHFANGGVLEDLGPRLPAIEAFPAFRAPKSAEGIDGLVIHVDRFGNLITDIRREDLPPGPSVTVDGRPVPLVLTYAEASGPNAIISSSDFLEIAVPNGNAARVLGAGPGSRVHVM